MKRIVLFLLAAMILILLFIWIFSIINKPEKVELKFSRFEKELFSINSDNVIKKSNRWHQEFDSFNEVFAAKIMQISTLDDRYCDALLAFTNDKDMRESYDSTALEFLDLSDLESDLELAFGYFSDAFPSYPIPKITTFFGGFNFGVVTYDDNIAIGLENFLGKYSKYYQYLGDPQYMRYQKQKRFISSNVMEAWFNEYFYNYLSGKDFLSMVIYKGKMMYFLDQMLPELVLQDKFRFTDKQMAWTVKNEASIWEYFIEEDLLFSKKESEYRSFINYAPFAKGMPKEAPARVAYFIGYRIVSEYMNNNIIDIEELMYLTNSREFLQHSNYKPNK